MMTPQQKKDYYQKMVDRNPNQGPWFFYQRGKFGYAMSNADTYETIENCRAELLNKHGIQDAVNMPHSQVIELYNMFTNEYPIFITPY